MSESATRRILAEELNIVPDVVMVEMHDNLFREFECSLQPLAGMENFIATLFPGALRPYDRRLRTPTIA